MLSGFRPGRSLLNISTSISWLSADMHLNSTRLTLQLFSLFASDTDVESFAEFHELTVIFGGVGRLKT